MFYLSPARLKKIVSYLRCNENIRDNIWDYPDTFYGCSSFCMSNCSGDCANGCWSACGGSVAFEQR